MNAIVVEKTDPSITPNVVADDLDTGHTVTLLDPLDEDRPDDAVVVTTRRAICRVALVATETAGRFQREAVEYDPMSWMLAPRKMFDGGSAIDACLDRDACMRGILVHGLGLGLDVDRSAIDALMSEEGDEFEEHEFRYLFAQDMSGARRKGRQRTARATRLRLYTATIANTRDNMMMQAFHASIAGSVGEVRARLAGLFGAELADVADIRLGLHPSAPLVVALVPTAVVEVIARMQRDCAAPDARTFAVDIQQCIQA